jgi:predicted Zn finger-like uncharacterized protein
MKLTCVGCNAKYSMADHKISGKIVRIRCRKCGEIIVASSVHEHPGGEVCAVPEVLAASPRIAERNEESVLFSLSALSARGQAKGLVSPPLPGASGAGQADPSGLIDIRMLALAQRSPSVRPKASDDIAHLGLGGVLLAPLLSPAAPPPIVATLPARRGGWPLVLAALIVALGSMVVVLLRRPAPKPAPLAIAEPAPGISLPREPTIDSTATASTASAVAVAAPPPAPLPTAPRRTAPRVASAKPPPVVPPPRQAPTVTTTQSAAQCCPGEAPTDCAIRRSVGAACSG